MTLSKSKQGFIILTYPRSGSHFLASALNSHPDVNCHGEVFNQKAYPGKGDTQQRLEKYWDGPLTGMSVHAYIGWRGRSGVWRGDGLFGNLFRLLPEDTKVVCLQRQNLLRRYLSHTLASQRKNWIVREQDKNAEAQVKKIRDLTITISPAALRRDVAVTRAIWADREAQFADTYLLTYEQLCADFAGRMRCVFEHIGADPAKCPKPKTDTLKVSGDSLRDQIKNYDALKKKFTGTDLECYFDE